MPRRTSCGLGGCCIDVPGYSTAPGTALHFWSCTEIPVPPPPCTAKPCPNMANQQFSWKDFGAVAGQQSGPSVDYHPHALQDQRVQCAKKYTFGSFTPLPYR